MSATINSALEQDIQFKINNDSSEYHIAFALEIDGQEADFKWNDFKLYTANSLFEDLTKHQNVTLTISNVTSNHFDVNVDVVFADVAIYNSAFITVETSADSTSTFSRLVSDPDVWLSQIDLWNSKQVPNAR